MLLFPELRAKLLSYKIASTDDRQKILIETIESVQKLKHVTNTPLALEAYESMAFAATIFNYADTLYRIENQAYFDILIDFKMPDLFKEPKFEKLNDYFEFHSQAPQMRLKNPLKSTPLEIWMLFRDAQQEQLKRRGKEHNFDLTELDIKNPPENQLYPLPIQMMGQLVNEAVDRVCSNAKGEYRFAHRYGSYLLPGGGMVEISMDKSQEKLMGKMLDEHLEEEHGNLAKKAASLFDEINKDLFLDEVRKHIPEEKLIASLGDVQLKADIERVLESDLSNAKILQSIIQRIDLVDIDESKKGAQIKFLRELRAGLQVNTFKLHPIYQDALAFIKENTIVLDIEQFGDVRACGGQQISHSFLMKKPLEYWFSSQFGDDSIEMADDLTGSDIVHMSLLEALKNFRHIKFSHILIVLTHQTTILKDKTLPLESIWNGDQYKEAKEALITEGIERLNAITGPSLKRDPRLFGMNLLQTQSSETEAPHYPCRP